MLNEKVIAMTRTKVAIQVQRTTRDSSGNPRYLVSHLALGIPYESTKLTRKAGLNIRRKLKSFGGGYVFQSHSVDYEMDYIMRTLHPAPAPLELSVCVDCYLYAIGEAAEIGSGMKQEQINIAREEIEREFAGRYEWPLQWLYSSTAGGFSRQKCECCGDKLGGDRYTLALRVQGDERVMTCPDCENIMFSEAGMLPSMSKVGKGKVVCSWCAEE